MEETGLPVVVAESRDLRRARLRIALERMDKLGRSSQRANAAPLANLMRASSTAAAAIIKASRRVRGRIFFVSRDCADHHRLVRAHA